ncbi:zinc finger ccch-type-containing 11a [Anaeramoeba flamelloides]|uniref:Zinc finger ccch-type-containing 11a n=1 Tax=Anaeramoeba flamelloides TaxID=1746091 RepID=A0AAV7ZBB4_9EUKA|nr:zinc finger ccch-type-containing 11a [Anaeramoeba flamelloides]
MSSFRRVTRKKTVLFLRFAIVSVSCLPSQSSPIFIKSKIGSSKFETKYLLPTKKIINFQEEFSANCTYYREATKKRAHDIGSGSEYLPKPLNFSLEQERSTNKKRCKIERIGKAKIETTDYIGVHEPLLKMIMFKLKNPKKHTTTPFLIVSIQIFADNTSKSVPLLKTLSIQLQVKQFLKKQKVKLGATKKLKANDRKNREGSNQKKNRITTGPDTTTTATTVTTVTTTDSKIKESNRKHKTHKISSKHNTKKPETKKLVNLHAVTNTESFKEKDLEDIILEQYTFNQTSNRSEYYTAFSNNSVTSFGSDLVSFRDSIRSEKPQKKHGSEHIFSFKGEHDKTNFKNSDQMKLKQLKNEISKKRKIISQKKRIISEFEYARQNMKKFKNQQKKKYTELDQQKKNIVNFHKQLDKNQFLVRKIKKKFQDYNSEGIEKKDQQEIIKYINQLKTIQKNRTKNKPAQKKKMKGKTETKKNNQKKLNKGNNKVKKEITNKSRKEHLKIKKQMKNSKKEKQKQNTIFTEKKIEENILKKKRELKIKKLELIGINEKKKKLKNSLQKNKNKNQKFMKELKNIQKKLKKRKTNKIKKPKLTEIKNKFIKMYLKENKNKIYSLKLRILLEKSKLKAHQSEYIKTLKKKSILESYNSQNKKKSKGDSKKEKPTQNGNENENENANENEIQKENENKKEKEKENENERKKEKKKLTEKKIRKKEEIKTAKTDKKGKAWNLNTETEKEIIHEQKKRLKEQKSEIHDIFKKLEIQQNIEKEKWLIERMFFFFTDIQSGEYPLPSSILIKFFIQSNSFADGYEEVLKTYLTSFDLLLFINRNNLNSTVWLFSNIFWSIRFLLSEMINFPEEYDLNKISQNRTKFKFYNNDINCKKNKHYSNMKKKCYRGSKVIDINNNSNYTSSSSSSSSNNDNNNNNRTNPFQKVKFYHSKHNSHNNISKTSNYKSLSQSFSLQDFHSSGKATSLVSSQTYLKLDKCPKTSESETPTTEFLIEGKIPSVIIMHEQLCKLLNQVYLKIRYMINEQLLPRVRKIFLKVYNSESKEFAQIIKYFAESMIRYLKSFIGLFKLTKLPQSICKAIIDQTIYSINTLIFNCFLQKKEMCTIGHSVKIKESLSQIEKFLDTTPFKNSKSLLRTVYNLIDLILMNKVVLKDQENDYFLCTSILNSISLRQIHHILSNFTPDEFDSAKINQNELDALLKFSQRRFSRSNESKKIRMDANWLIPVEIDFLQSHCNNWHLFKLPEQLKKEINTFLYN